MDPLLSLISLSVGVFGGLLLGFTGVAVGAAARYGLPQAWRLPGGWVFSVAGIALLAATTTAAVDANDGPNPHTLDWLAMIIASWLPGFIAAAMGANRLMLVATLPIAAVLVSFLAPILGSSFAVSPL